MTPFSMTQGGRTNHIAGTHQNLDVVYFKLFDNCNAKCNMCDCWERPRFQPSRDHYRETLSRVLAAKPRSLRFTGGEPLMYRELPELIAAAAEAGALVSVITNGRLLRGKVDQLADNGCREVILSLDATGETHNLIRGTPRLFEQGLAGIDRIGATSMSYGVNTVVQAMGLRDLPRLAELLLHQAQPPAWWHLIPVRDHEALMLSEIDKDWFTSTVGTLSQEMAAEGVQIICDKAMFKTSHDKRCSVPEFALYVDAVSGNVYGCNMLAYADPPLGDLHEESLAAIRSGTRSIELQRSCATAAHEACNRCDPSSRKMNHWLQIRAHEISRRNE